MSRQQVVFRTHDSVDGALVQHSIEATIFKSHLLRIHRQEFHAAPQLCIPIGHLFNDFLAQVDVDEVATQPIVHVLVEGSITTANIQHSLPLPKMVWLILEDSLSCSIGTLSSSNVSNQSKVFPDSFL